MVDCACILRLQKESIKVVKYLRAMYDESLVALKAANINYYTHDPPDSVPVKIVLSGYVPRSIPELLILERPRFSRGK